jgi:hypothetical protein
MPDHTTAPLTTEREQEIRDSIPTVYTAPWTVEPMEDNTWRVMYATDHPLAGLVAEVPDYGAQLAEFIAEARTAVPELLAEIDRLRAAAEVFRAEFGNLVVKGQDGDWANVADWIATGARIPACGAFYPSATDTRCYLAKGHRRTHLAPWGTRDMAWPYDPRETQQPLTAAELAVAQADVDHLNAEFPDESTVDQAPAAVETGE